MEVTNSPTFVLKDQITCENYNQSGAEAYGETPNYTYDNISFKPQSYINISRIALKSWLTLASTMGHELNHYYHFLSGKYDGWVKNHGIDFANAKSEYISQRWELLAGGIPTASIMTYNWNIIKTYK